MGEAVKFAPDDRIKLTPEMAATMMRGLAPGVRRLHSVDWHARCGTVHHIRQNVVVLRWDGVKSFDRWPERALQLAELSA